jgi:hypothetical protein
MTHWFDTFTVTLSRRGALKALGGLVAVFIAQRAAIEPAEALSDKTECDVVCGTKAGCTSCDPRTCTSTQADCDPIYTPQYGTQSSLCRDGVCVICTKGIAVENNNGQVRCRYNGSNHDTAKLGCASCGACNAECGVVCEGCPGCPDCP